jgi:hypothetical protein
MSEVTANAESAKAAEIQATHALIEWTGDGIKHFTDGVTSAFCIPGAITPVPVELWTTVRDWVKDLIVEDVKSIDEATKKQGRFVEHHVTVKKGPGGRVASVSAKDLVNLSDSEARAMVAKMVDPALLNAYLDSEDLDGRDVVKGAIERRIKEVEAKGSKGKK